MNSYGSIICQNRTYQFAVIEHSLPLWNPEVKVTFKLDPGYEILQIQPWHLIGPGYILWGLWISLLLTGWCGDLQLFVLQCGRKGVPWCNIFGKHCIFLGELYIIILKFLTSPRAKKYLSFFNSEFSNIFEHGIKKKTQTKIQPTNIQGWGWRAMQRSIEKPAQKFFRILQFIKYIIINSKSLHEFALFLFNIFCKFYNRE